MAMMAIFDIDCKTKTVPIIRLTPDILFLMVLCGMNGFSLSGFRCPGEQP